NVDDVERVAPLARLGFQMDDFDLADRDRARVDDRRVRDGSRGHQSTHHTERGTGPTARESGSAKPREERRYDFRHHGAPLSSRALRKGRTRTRRSTFGQSSAQALANRNKIADSSRPLRSFLPIGPRAASASVLKTLGR